jgi:hemoglobin
MVAGVSHGASTTAGSERMSTFSRFAMPASSGVGEGAGSHRRGNLVAALAGGALALFVLGCAMPVTHSGSSLFQRMGGMPTMTAVADEVVDAVASGGTGARPFTAASLPLIKRELALRMCIRAGGACRQAGDQSPRALDGIRLTGEEFERMVSAMRGALEARVAERDKNDMLRMLAPMRREIAGA